MLESLKRKFGKTKFILVKLEPSNDIEQSPLFDDFGFKITSGSFAGVVFRLRSLVALVGNKTDDRLPVTYDIKLETVPKTNRYTREQLLDVNHPMYYNFMSEVRYVVSEFVGRAYEDDVAEQNENKSNHDPDNRPNDQV